MKYKKLIIYILEVVEDTHPHLLALDHVIDMNVDVLDLMSVDVLDHQKLMIAEKSMKYCGNYYHF